MSQSEVVAIQSPTGVPVLSPKTLPRVLVGGLLALLAAEYHRDPTGPITRERVVSVLVQAGLFLAGIYSPGVRR